MVIRQSPLQGRVAPSPRPPLRLTPRLLPLDPLPVRGDASVMDDRTPDPPAGEQVPPQPPVPRIGDDGKPVYDQEFFLALAKCGKDEWNRWRENEPDILVTFKGIVFRSGD